MSLKRLCRTPAAFVLLSCILTMSVIPSVWANPSIKCAAYLLKLKTLYETSKGLFFSQIAPYMLYSGKQIDDLGFPKMCIENDMTFTSVKISAESTKPEDVQHHPHFDYEFFYGLCFNKVCSVSDLNEGGEFVIDNIFATQPLKIERASFYEAELHRKFSASSLVVCLLIVIWFSICMVGLFAKWCRQCADRSSRYSHEEESHKNDIEFSLSEKSTAKPTLKSNEASDEQPRLLSSISLSESSSDQQYDEPISNPVLRTISVGRKWHQMWSSEQSTKIIQFSLFKILAVPLVLFGYYFYLCNVGSVNIFSFNDEIYQSFYSRVAVFAIYLPDVFFLISGYLFARKVFTQIEYASSRGKFLLKCLLLKFVRLYPIYIACIAIFYFVIPSLHAGPLWSMYVNEQIEEQCNPSALYRNVFLIDNMFTHGCYDFAWWVQAELQYAIFATVVFFLFFIHRSAASVFLYLSLFASYVLMFVFAEPLPVELEITTSHHTLHSMKMFQTHLPFYLSGLVLGMLFKKESTKKFIIRFYFKNMILFGIGLLSSVVVFGLILFRPATFSYDSLGLQLSLSRIGVVWAFLIWFLPGMVKERAKTTILHNLASLTYPIILVSGMIVSASYWSLQTLPYTSYGNLLYNCIPNLMISLAVGVFLDLAFNFTRKRESISRPI